MRFVLSLAEQGFGSVLTFAINLWLIRNGASESYGVYAFWLAVAWVMGTAQGTLVTAHLYRLPSALTHAAARRDPERLFLTVTLAILAVSALGVAAVDAALVAAGSPLAAAPAVLFIPAFLLFQYVRAFAFSRQRPALAAGLTGGILLATILALGADWLLGHAPDAGRVLLLTGLAYGGVSLAVLLVLLAGATPLLRPEAIRRHAHLLHGSFWLMLGAGSGEVTTRLYSFAVVGRWGADALATISAVQLVIRPAWLLASSWGSIGFPQMAARRAEGDRAGLLRTLLTGALSTAAGSAVWSLVTVAAWPFVSRVLFHGRYAEVGPLVWLFGINVVLGSIMLAMNAAVLSVGEYKRLALIDLAGAVVTVAVLGAVVLRLDYAWTIGATLCGQATQILLMGRVLQARLRQPLAYA